MIRHNQQDTQFKAAASGKTYKIRAGDKVMMYPPAVHKDPEIFDSPEVSKIRHNLGKLNKLSMTDNSSMASENIACINIPKDLTIIVPWATGG